MEAEQDPQPDVVSSRRATALVERALARVGVDFPPERWRPDPLWLAVAALLSIVGSLAADIVLVAVGTTVFPATNGYVHFRFSDYGKLTVIGVIIACVAWPIVTRISSSPRWLFFRLAVVVTLFLWLPDLYILWKGQPAKAVAVLMVMHLAIAVVTYSGASTWLRPGGSAGLTVRRRGDPAVTPASLSDSICLAHSKPTGPSQ